MEVDELMANIQRFILDLRDSLERRNASTFVRVIDRIFNLNESVKISDFVTQQTSFNGYVIFDSSVTQEPIRVGQWIITPRDDLPSNIVTLNGVAVTINNVVVTT